MDCGANDGVYESNTLSLEMDFAWTGILIEASPKTIERLKQVHRKAWIVPTGLSIKNETMEVEFGDWGAVGQIVDESVKNSKFGKFGKAHTIPIMCLPLYSILQALDNPTVDFFNLDVEGYEFEILKTIPFDKVDIKVNLTKHFQFL